MSDYENYSCDFDKICSINEKSVCQTCRIKDEVHFCSGKNENKFYWLNLTPTVFTGLSGLIIASIFILNIIWPLVITAAVILIFWGLGLETKLLCSRCPNYGNSQNKISCWALKGYPRLWKYDPRPLSIKERLLLRSVYAFIILAVAGTILWSILYLRSNLAVYGLIALFSQSVILISFILSGINMLIAKKKIFCSKCANIYCALNSLSDELKDEILIKFQ